MTKAVVNLNELRKLNMFVNDMCTFVADIDAVRGRYVIDARSIMGMISLDLSTPLDIVINSDDEAEINRFLEVTKRYQ